jgi:hypothetical protein
MSWADISFILLGAIEGRPMMDEGRPLMEDWRLADDERPLDWRFCCEPLARLSTDVDRLGICEGNEGRIIFCFLFSYKRYLNFRK